MTRLLAAALALLLPASAFAAHARRVERLVTPQGLKGGVEVMAEEALICLDDNTPRAAIEQGLRAAGVDYVRAAGGGPWHLVYLPAGMPTATGLSLLKAQAGVVDAEPNHVFRPSKLPNDPQVASQYHLSNINAFPAWEYEVGTSNPVIIAVMDTGIEGTHPDLAAKLVGGLSRDCSSGVCGADTAGGKPSPHPACDHATRVSGVAAAVTNNGTGVAGVSWGAQLVSVKVFPDATCNPDCSNNGAPGCTASDDAIIAGINYAAGLTAPGRRVVMNMSLGASGACPTNPLGLPSPPNPKPVQQAIDAAYAGANGGVLFVASAGNDGGEVNNPANCNNVIPVGATDASNNIASFSSRDVAGTAMATRGLVAPGVALLTTDVNASYTGSASGTSFSSPIVAGMAALVLSAKPALTNDQVRDVMRNSTSKIGVASLDLGEGVHPMASTAGAGLLNAYSAMRLAITGSTQFDGTEKAIAFPNPFKVASQGTVTITVPNSIQAANASIRVYTTTGQLVKTLKGFSWDGKNDDGNPVATGTYVFLVSTDKGTTSGRVAVIR